MFVASPRDLIGVLVACLCWLPSRVVLKGWRQTTKSRGKMVEGKYVPGATLPQANWTNHSYVPMTLL